MFVLESEQDVKVSIYDLNGNLVRTLVDSKLTEGKHHITWDGNGISGNDMSLGVYVVKLTTTNTVGQETVVKTR